MTNHFDFKKWIQRTKRGNGEVVEVTFAFIAITAVFLLLINTFTLYFVFRYMSEASQIICRNVVVCKTYEDAEKEANEEAKKYFIGKNNIGNHFITNVKAEIQPLESGGKSGKVDWKKGNFIRLVLICDTPEAYPSFSTKSKHTHYVSTPMMIERDSL